ncbi:enoyl-CoA hydratase [Oceanobacillus kimchii]|uniref:Enoyl-CoA hydratase n=1 Tax=Oceanobacillus kimchii TaxID=746691 RepID=A0ABQ5THJ7_9BACI|nr:enoyl-CoA hydratase [Oceanobacillus kimchii]MCT1578971.1 enoyl-CoA hydratase [Oceanobacillus kimchii]MCT2137896.1 enoyl-CoA hydratase [Oceanobacillus kimchii]GLO65129.1 enoyl-CoA hydratase [Oceanobacillus kimchii]
MSDFKYEDVIVDIKENVMYLTLNRPDSLNAFSPEMILGLKESLTEANTNDRVKAIVIKGSGRSFSAGGDVKTMGKKDPIHTYDHIGKLNELIIQMNNLEKPIIAAVHGYAAGAGFNLALASDLIVATEGSNFILSFSKVGLISDGGGLYFLPRIVGPYLAKELFFNAEPISVEKAHSLGIVNQIYTVDQFDDEVEKFASKIASGPSYAYGFIKKLTNLSLTSSLSEILEQERITQATMVTTEDHAEGVQAFKEKRNPQFGKNESKESRR